MPFIYGSPRPIVSDFQRDTYNGHTQAQKNKSKSGQVFKKKKNFGGRPTRPTWEICACESGDTQKPVSASRP